MMIRSAIISTVTTTVFASLEFTEPKVDNVTDIGIDPSKWTTFNGVFSGISNKGGVEWLDFKPFKDYREFSRNLYAYATEDERTKYKFLKRYSDKWTKGNKKKAADRIVAVARAHFDYGRAKEGGWKIKTIWPEITMVPNTLKEIDFYDNVPQQNLDGERTDYKSKIVLVIDAKGNDYIEITSEMYGTDVTRHRIRDMESSESVTLVSGSFPHLVLQSRSKSEIYPDFTTGQYTQQQAEQELELIHEAFKLLSKNKAVQSNIDMICNHKSESAMSKVPLQAGGATSHLKFKNRGFTLPEGSQRIGLGSQSFDKIGGMTMNDRRFPDFPSRPVSKLKTSTADKLNYYEKRGGQIPSVRRKEQRFPAEQKEDSEASKKLQSSEQDSVSDSEQRLFPGTELIGNEI